MYLKLCMLCTDKVQYGKLENVLVQTGSLIEARSLLQAGVLRHLF